MFAVVRTGGKQYRVAEGDKIAVEKLAGEAGERVELGDILLAGEGADLADVAKVKVAAEIIAQAKSEKVTVFKKRRRHNYRRKAGHRQQMTLLRILSVGEEGKQAAPKKAAATKDDERKAPEGKAPESKAPESTAPESKAAGDKPQPSEPAKGADVDTSDKAHKAEPVKDAAGGKPADSE